jgi:hypothetical protein
MVKHIIYRMQQASKMTIARRSGVRVTGGGAEPIITEDAVLRTKFTSPNVHNHVTIEAQRSPPVEKHIDTKKCDAAP